jgi:hypothetical protein
LPKALADARAELAAALAHYAMDVLAGRTLALYDLAQLLANKSGYVGVRPEHDAVIPVFGGAGDHLLVPLRHQQSQQNRLHVM